LTQSDQGRGLRLTVRRVALLNLAYFCVEFGVALAIGSVALFADSIDFLEDASVNLLIWLGLGWSPVNRARLGIGLAVVLLVPSVAAIWTAFVRLTSGLPAPAALPLFATGLGALGVNLTCALMLARYRQQGGSLTRAAFLSARNDVLANAAILVAGFATALQRSGWPDLIVGLGIAAMNGRAAYEVFHVARRERQSPLVN